LQKGLEFRIKQWEASVVFVQQEGRMMMTSKSDVVALEDGTEYVMWNFSIDSSN
jgi:hypothetical protein